MNRTHGLFHSYAAAMRAAVLGLGLLAAPGVALGQYTAPFQVNGSVVTTQPITTGDGTGFDDINGGYTSFTIGAQTTISAAQPYGGNGNSFPGVYLIRAETAS